MNINTNEFLRRVEILSDVVNSGEKGKADYAADYNVTEITINRDLNWLRNQGIPIYSRKGKVSLEGQPQKEILDTLLADYLPLKLNSDIFLKKVRLFSKVKQVDYFNHLVLLAKAVNEGNVIAVSYRRLGDDVLNQYELLPIRLVSDDLNWILHAFKSNEEILKTFYISRIEKITILPNKYKQSPLLKENKKAEDIVLRFHPSVEKEIVYKIWFEDFTIEKDQDGYLLLSTKQPVNNQLASWCISWWDWIKVVKPVTLINHIEEMIEAFLYNQRNDK